MRKIIVSEYVTLDGVMEEPGTWSFPFWNEEASQFKFDELFESSALLMGRVTYQGFAKAWPTRTDTGAYGERMNSLPKYVVSTSLAEVTWNASLIKDHIAEEVSKLKQESGQDVLVFGSGELVHTLMQHDLIDEYRLYLRPVVLGKGTPFFAGPRPPLRLVSSDRVGEDAVRLTYVPA